MNPITMKLVVDDLILQALREDITFEDVSTASVCPTARPATVELSPRPMGIIAGLDVFARTFELLDPQSSVLFDVADGDRGTTPGDHVGQVRGDARVATFGRARGAQLSTRMSGTATLARIGGWLRSRAPRPCLSTRARPRRVCVSSRRPQSRSAVAATTAITCRRLSCSRTTTSTPPVARRVRLRWRAPCVVYHDGRD